MNSDSPNTADIVERHEPQTAREWAELIAAQFETDATDAIEEGVQRGASLAEALSERFLLAADYYIAGLQAGQRRVRVRDLDERHVAYDRARAALKDHRKAQAHD